jgi:hypothetical protein
MPEGPEKPDDPVTEEDGFVVVLVSGQHEYFGRDLAECVRRSIGGVLVVATRRIPAPAPVVAVMPRRGSDGGVGPAVWLGPLSSDNDRRTLLRWLEAGGPLQKPVPSTLGHRVIGASPPAVSVN